MNHNPNAIPQLSVCQCGHAHERTADGFCAMCNVTGRRAPCTPILPDGFLLAFATQTVEARAEIHGDNDRDWLRL